MHENVQHFKYFKVSEHYVYPGLITYIFFLQILCISPAPFMGQHIILFMHPPQKPGQCIRYSDWLRAGRPKGPSSCPGRVKNFLFSMSSRPALWPTQPPIQWVPGALSPVAQRPGREAGHSPPASTEVRKMWIYGSIPSYAFMA
jgi:hypothetical protein